MTTTFPLPSAEQQMQTGNKHFTIGKRKQLNSTTTTHPSPDAQLSNICSSRQAYGTNTTLPNKEQSTESPPSSTTKTWTPQASSRNQENVSPGQQTTNEPEHPLNPQTKNNYEKTKQSQSNNSTQQGPPTPAIIKSVGNSSSARVID